jgi:O-antigen/teichoic acid export membrane protein
MLLGLIAVADPLIEVVLTEKWLPASEYFKLLCLIGLFYSFQVVNGEILKTKGRLDWVLKLEIISKTIMVISVLITWRWGITAIILGQMFTAVIAYLIGSYYVWKLIGYSLSQQFKDIFVYLALSVSMYLLVILISRFIENQLFSLLAMSISGAVFYFVAAWILKLEEIQEAKKMIKG